jgi:hypothetical protein
MRIFALLLAACSAIFLVAQPIASACSSFTCGKAYLVPEDGKSVPENIPGLFWRPALSQSEQHTDDSAKVTLTEVETGREILVSFESVLTDRILRVDDEYVAGNHYRLVDENTCTGEESAEPALDVVFQATPAAALPTTLGTLSVTTDSSQPVTVATSSGSCDVTAEAAIADIAVEPSSEAAAWMDALHFTVMVDGKAWGVTKDIREANPPGASWKGRGRTTLFAACDEESRDKIGGLAPGAHTVKVVAELPGSPVAIETEETEVLLGCEEEQSLGCAAAGGRATGFALFAVAIFGFALRRR